MGRTKEDGHREAEGKVSPTTRLLNQFPERKAVEGFVKDFLKETKVDALAIAWGTIARAYVSRGKARTQHFFLADDVDEEGEGEIQPQAAPTRFW